MCEYQLALLLSGPEDGNVALPRDRPERPGYCARFAARRPAACAAERECELGACADAHTVGNAARQGAAIGDEQPPCAGCCIFVRIGFQLVAEDRRSLILDTQRGAIASGGLDIGRRRAAADGNQNERKSQVQALRLYTADTVV